MSEGDSAGRPTATYWFKRRRYGWGYTPVTWQGWLAVGALLVLVLVPAFGISSGAGAAAYLVWVLVVLVGFVVLVIRTGPPPRWRWGRSPGDDPDQDF